MAEQRTFARIAWNQKGKVTRREQFLAEMDAVIPWGFQPAARLVETGTPGRPRRFPSGARAEASVRLRVAMASGLSLPAMSTHPEPPAEPADRQFVVIREVLNIETFKRLTQRICSV